MDYRVICLALLELRRPVRRGGCACRSLANVHPAHQSVQCARDQSISLGRGRSASLTAPVGHRAVQAPQPEQRAGSCSTEVFFQWWVSKANKRNSQAEIQRPQPEQRAASTCAVCALGWFGPPPGASSIVRFKSAWRRHRSRPRHRPPVPASAICQRWCKGARCPD